MPTQLITCGTTFTMQTNVVYALPGKNVRLFTSPTPVDYAINLAGPWVALIGSNTIGSNSLTTGVEVAGGFIRSATGPCDVLCNK